MGCIEGAEREAAGRTDTASAAATPRVPLTLELLLPRPEVRLGEPVAALAVLRNTGNEPLSLRPLLDPAYGRLEVWIAPPDGAAKRLRPPVFAEARGTPARELAPGAAWSTAVPLYYSARGWVLQRAGLYRVWMEYASELGKLTTPRRPLRVTPPKEPAEAQAAAVMMRPEAATFIFFGGPTGKEDGRPSLELVRTKDPKGPLAPYAEVALGLAEATPAYDQVTRTFRPARCAEQAPQLTQTMRKVADPLFAARGAAALVRCLRDAGRMADADKVLTAFYDAHPEVRSFPGAESWFEPPAKSGRR